MVAVNYLVIDKTSRNTSRALPFAMIMITFLVLVVGTRSISHGSDTVRYAELFSSFMSWNGNTTMGLRLESGFTFFAKWLSLIFGDIQTVIFFFALMFGMAWLLTFYVWRRGSSVFFCTFLFISLFYTYNLGGNIIRQGIAIPLGILSMYFMFVGRRYLSVVFFLVGLSFHSSALVLFISAVIVNTYNSKRLFYLALAICTMVSISGIIDTDFIIRFVTSYTDYGHIVSNYAFDRYDVGFRAEFWAFTMLPVVAFYFVDENRMSEIYLKLFSSYILISCLFILVFNIPFSDRVGVIAWSLIPLILASFLGNYRYRVLNDRFVFFIIIFLGGLLSFLTVDLMSFGDF
jgi:hypothetical protein